MQGNNELFFNKLLKNIYTKSLSSYRTPQPATMHKTNAAIRACVPTAALFCLGGFEHKV